MASAVKLVCSETAGRVIDKAVQIFGGRGYMREQPVERLYRELRVDRIWEGTSEIQRVVIGNELRKRGSDLFTGWPGRGHLGPEHAALDLGRQAGVREAAAALREVVRLAGPPAGQPRIGSRTRCAESYWKPLQSGEVNPSVSYGATAETPRPNARCSTMNRPW